MIYFPHLFLTDSMPEMDIRLICSVPAVSRMHIVQCKRSVIFYWE